MVSNPQLLLVNEFLEQTGTHIFLTGKAGTGKTTFLRNLRLHSPKRMIVVAPTGVAAINAGGVTIHSFFQLPFGVHLPDSMPIKRRESPEQKHFNRTKIALIRSLDLLVIDEISMVRADMLDAVDEVLRRYRDRTKPFGGVQLLMIGDLQQLSPVVRDDEWNLLREYYRTPFFFDSLALHKTTYTSIELKHIYRQSDAEFIDLLARVRNNEMDEDTLSRLNARYDPNFDPPQQEGYITLTAHNDTARGINDRKMAQLTEREYGYTAQVEGNFPDKLYPVDFSLVLKRGAQVMFAKNDPSADKRFVNGTIGTVTELDSDHIEVTPADGDPILVELAAWENISYSIDAQTKEVTEKIEGIYRQYPLKMAWAITIHKSQGLTFERAIIDAADSFSHGQVYVALSRCKTLEGMVLRSPIPTRAIINDSTVRAFNQSVEQNQPSEHELAELKRAYFVELACELFDFVPLRAQLQALRRHADEHLMRLYPKLVARWEDVTPIFSEEIVKVSDRFKLHIRNLVAENSTKEAFQDRIFKGANYFLDQLTTHVSPLVEAHRVEVDNKEVRKGLNDILGHIEVIMRVKLATLLDSQTDFGVKRYLTAKSKAVVGVTLEGAPIVKKAKSASSSEAASKSRQETPSEDLLHPALFEALREWRKGKATQSSLPAYVVLQQKSLIGIANTLPRSSRELLVVPGVGPKKIDKYGAEILGIIDDYLK